MDSIETDHSEFNLKPHLNLNLKAHSILNLNCEIYEAGTDSNLKEYWDAFYDRARAAGFMERALDKISSLVFWILVRDYVKGHRREQRALRSSLSPEATEQLQTVETVFEQIMEEEDGVLHLMRLLTTHWRLRDICKNALAQKRAASRAKDVVHLNGF